MENRRPLFGRDSYGVNPSLGTPKLTPFGDPRPHPMDAVTPTTPREAYEIKNAYENPVPTLLPRHLYAPEGARTINLQRVISVAPGANVPLFDFECFKDTSLVIFQYGLFTDAPPLSGLQWYPTVDGSRVLEYHGDPANGFTMSEPTGTSLSSTDLVPCQILMEPGQKLAWSVQNGSNAAALMGVRMVGYLDMSQRLMSSKFGD